MFKHHVSYRRVQCLTNTIFEQETIPYFTSGGSFSEILHLQKNLSIAELANWQHFPCPSVPGSDFEVKHLMTTF